MYSWKTVNNKRLWHYTQMQKIRGGKTSVEQSAFLCETAAFHYCQGSSPLFHCWSRKQTVGWRHGILTKQYPPLPRLSPPLVKAESPDCPVFDACLQFCCLTFDSRSEMCLFNKWAAVRWVWWITEFIVSLMMQLTACVWQFKGKAGLVKL